MHEQDRECAKRTGAGPSPSCGSRAGAGRGFVSWVLLGAAVAALLAVSGCAVWRLGEARELARRSEPFQHRPVDARLRLLIVGDSTGVGTGATTPKMSLAGRLAQTYPRLAIDNRARNGARFADVASQLADAPQADLTLILAGANDVIRLRGEAALREDIERVLTLAAARSGHVVVMPAGNVGNAPFFLPPLSSWMTARARTMHGLVRAAAARHGAAYVRLFQERAEDPFTHNRDLHASDGLHPSDAGYALWYRELLAQTDLQRRLAPAAAPTAEAGAGALATPAAAAEQPPMQR
jgi:lysophospholipase L1-like esterase